MGFHDAHPFRHIHEPLRMDLMAWLTLTLGVLIGLFCHPQFRM